MAIMSNLNLLAITMKPVFSFLFEIIFENREQTAKIKKPDVIVAKKIDLISSICRDVKKKKDSFLKFS